MADTLREQIADELWRQIIEDFRNPTLGAPDVPGAMRPTRLLLERADRILALLAERGATTREPTLDQIIEVVEEATEECFNATEMAMAIQGLYWRARAQGATGTAQTASREAGTQVGEVRSTLEACRAALESLPIDALGEGSAEVTAPDGETGLMTWSIRDELIDSINHALR